MSALRMAYLALALAGALVQLWPDPDSMLPTGWPAPWRLLEDWNFPDRFYLVVAWDRIVAFLALSLWALAEVSVRRNWSALLAIPATILFGIGCGLPLYLFLRSRPIR